MSKIKESLYTKGNLNADIFGAKGRLFEKYFASTKYFLTEKYIRSGMTFLDVGGGVGILLMLFAQTYPRLVEQL